MELKRCRSHMMWKGFEQGRGINLLLQICFHASWMEAIVHKSEQGRMGTVVRESLDF